MVAIAAVGHAGPMGGAIDSVSSRSRCVDHTRTPHAPSASRPMAANPTCMVLRSEGTESESRAWTMLVAVGRQRHDLLFNALRNS